MRVAPLVASLLLAALPGVSFAQEWVEFTSAEERFTCTFPGQPTVTDTTWMSQFGAVLPARIYTGTQGVGRYSVTVVDYNPIQRLLGEKSMSCPAGAETCQGIHDWGLGYWKNDIRGAVVYATSKYLARDASLTNLMANFADLVAGQELELTSRTDGSRTFASIYMHENRLVMMEATVPKNYPPPTIFQQSLGWLDENGARIRYQVINHNEPDLPRPPIRGR